VREHRHIDLIISPFVAGAPDSSVMYALSHRHQLSRYKKLTPSSHFAPR
jgi:hypothetical protein